jgi:hypothetical protein
MRREGTTRGVECLARRRFDTSSRLRLLLACLVGSVGSAFS